MEHKEITLRMPFDNAGDIIALTFEEMSFVADIAASQVNDSKPEPSRADVLKAVIKLMFSPKVLRSLRGNASSGPAAKVHHVSELVGKRFPSVAPMDWRKTKKHLAHYCKQA